jgi:flagellar biogenesis protein FliO
MALLSFATPFFWISPLIPWAMVVATISVSCWLIYRLQSTSEKSESGNHLTETFQAEPVGRETDPAQSLSLIEHS